MAGLQVLAVAHRRRAASTASRRRIRSHGGISNADATRHAAPRARAGAIGAGSHAALPRRRRAREECAGRMYA
jgi:hypothetical protein